MLDLASGSSMLEKLKADTLMKNLAGMLVLLGGLAAMAFARQPPPEAAPEIDPGSALSALVLLSSVSLVIRGRRKS